MSKTLFVFVLAILLIVVISANAHLGDQPDTKIVGGYADHYVDQYLLNSRGLVGYFIHEMIWQVYENPKVCPVYFSVCG